MHDVLEHVALWCDAGLGVALATVIETWGSSPRPAGSQLAVNENGEFVGSVSGGCVEASVVNAALGVIQSGAPRLLEFGVENETAWEVGLPCGGHIEIYVERVEERELFDALRAQCAAKQPVVLVMELDTGRKELISPQRPEPAPSKARLERAREVLRRDRCEILDEKMGRVFLQPFNPPLRLILVGAVHIAQTLSRMAADAGYEVIVVDPRRAFAREQSFETATLVREWPDAALRALAPDGRTAVAVLAHDPKLDESALDAALRSEAFYVGALGSRRTHAGRCQRLRERGFSAADLARVHGPIGLDIGAQSPAEIAVSILAEITRALRQERA
jgi:xanthine dehydrogenase accessory factor